MSKAKRSKGFPECYCLLMIDDLVIVIPARLDSNRLPNKPLIEFNGIPMIVRVAQKCAEVLDKRKIFVSTPDEQIITICKSHGINAVRSSTSALSGTDLIVEFSKGNDYSRIINVQGDELLLTAECLENFILESRNNQNCTIGVMKISDQHELTKASVVKVAISENKLIYASRSQIPNDTYANEISAYKHTGLYMFTKDSLNQFSFQKQGYLEKTERIEILRFIENRIPVDVVEVNNYFFTIDTEDDVIAAKQLLERRNS